MQHGPGMHGGVIGMMIILGVVVAALAFLAWKIFLAWRIHRRHGTNAEETEGQGSTEE